MKIWPYHRKISNKVCRGPKHPAIIREPLLLGVPTYKIILNGIFKCKTPPVQGICGNQVCISKSDMDI